MKTVTIKVEGASQGQWSTFLLELNLMKLSVIKNPRKQSLITASLGNKFISESIAIKNETKEWSNEADFNDEDIIDPLAFEMKQEDTKSEVECAICNKIFRNKKVCAMHLFQNHRDACTICFKQFESKKDMEAHISKDHPLSDFRNVATRCVICDLSYRKDKENVKKFKEHMVFEHNVSLKHRNTCNVCLKQFESKQHLEDHISTAHTLRDFKKRLRCVICNILFKTKNKDKSTLMKHMQSEHKVGYKCPICQMKQPSLSTLNQHKIQEHNSAVKIKYLCPKCGKEFIDKPKYDQHVSKLSCNQLIGEKCPICEETFESMSLKSDHLATKHKDVKLHDCSECSSRFITKNGLKRHISKVHRNVGNICPTCGKTYKSISVLEDHISYVHEGKVKPRFKCYMCEESYSTMKYLENHMSVHEGNGIFQCSNCNMEFNSKNRLEAHIAKEHDRSKLHKCEHCDSSYVTKHGLIGHIAFVHEKTISNICPHCGKNCNGKANLKSHVRNAHELVGIKPYKCGDCGKYFRTENEKKKHIKIVHEGKFTINCPICQKSFKTNGVLKKHIDAVHEKKRPHGCDICNETFSQSAHLKTHKKGKHKIIM